MEYLRQAKHLSVVEIRFFGRRDGHYSQLPDSLRKAWKSGLIDVLKSSPSKDRKFLRWMVFRTYLQPVDKYWAREVVEAEELEVFPESPL